MPPYLTYDHARSNHLRTRAMALRLARGPCGPHHGLPPDGAARREVAALASRERRRALGLKPRGKRC